MTQIKYPLKLVRDNIISGRELSIRHPNIMFYCYMFYVKSSLKQYTYTNDIFLLSEDFKAIYHTKDILRYTVMNGIVLSQNFEIKDNVVVTRGA